MCVCVCARVYACECACVRVRVYTPTHPHTYAYTYIHTKTYLLVHSLALNLKVLKRGNLLSFHPICKIRIQVLDGLLSSNAS